MGQRKSVMTGTAAVIVEVDAAIGRFAAEGDHRLGIVNQAVAVAADRFARSKADAEAAAVVLDADG